MIPEKRPVLCTTHRFSTVPVPYVWVALHAIMMASLVTSRIFLGNFIAKNAGSYSPVGEYYLILFLAQIATFILSARQCKEGSFLPFIRIGLFAHIAFFGLLAFLGEDLPLFLIPLAIAHGVAQGLYWLPFVQYTIGFSKPKRRAKFFASLNIAAQIAGVLTPAICGYVIIHGGGHGQVFLGIASLFVLALILNVGFLKYNSGARGRYEPAKIFASFKQHKEIRNVYRVMFVLGCTSWGAMELFTPLLVFHLTGSELSLGIIASCLPLIEITSSVITGRSGQIRHPLLARCSSSLIGLGAILYAIFSTYPVVLFYACAFALCAPCLAIIANTFGASIVFRYEELLNHQTEYIVLREFALSFGRILGYGTFTLVTLFGAGGDVLRLTLALFGVLVIGVGWFLRGAGVEDRDSVVET